MDNNSGKTDSSNHDSVDTSGLEREKFFGKQLLMQDAYDAQRGSKVAQNRLLETKDWLKDVGILNTVLTELEDDTFIKLNRKSDGTPKEIIFDKQLPGYPPATVKIDIEKNEVNSKGRAQLEKEAVAEKKEFVDALAVSDTRHPPEGEQKALTQTQKEQLKKLEQAYGSGDIASIKKLFQSSPNDRAWSRLAKELSQDFNSPDSMHFGKDSKGSPFIALTFENTRNGEIDFESIVIPAKGEMGAYRHNEQGVPDLSQASDKTTAQAWAAIQSQRESELTKKMSDYRCDFDEHEQRSGKKLDQQVSQKTIVNQYNTYTTHYCGEEFQD